MNGVELPCGSILSVEPADMDYKKKQTIEKLDNKNGASDSLPTTEKEKERSDNRNTHADGQIDSNQSPTKELEDDNDDLDDFFASL